MDRRMRPIAVRCGGIYDSDFGAHAATVGRTPRFQKRVTARFA